MGRTTATIRTATHVTHPGIGVCAYLATVYLTADARRLGDHEMAAAFRRRAIITGIVVGLLAAAGLAVLHADARPLFDRLTGRALALVVISAVAGVASLVLLAGRAFTLVRLTAALAVAAVLWAWGVAQYPDLLPPALTVSRAAAHPDTLRATVISLAVGAVLLVPSLAWLFVLFQRGHSSTTR